MDKVLWVRELSCGHERATNLAFIVGDYSKPKLGDHAYCRECCEEVTITRVKKSDISGDNDGKDRFIGER